MYRVYKLKSIFVNTKPFVNSLHHVRYSLRNIIFEKKNSIIFGSLVGFSYLVYIQDKKEFQFGYRTAFCSNSFFSKGPIIIPLTVKEEETMTEEIITVKKSDEIIENKSESLIFETELPSNTTTALPTEVPYLIIGGGIAGLSAARAIRASDPFAKVIIINYECQNPGEHKASYPPYRRILLSKFIWRRSEEQKKELLDVTGDVKSSSFLYIEPESFFVPIESLHRMEYGGISILNDTKVASIDPRELSITLEGSGHKIRFKACLIATGSYPRRLMNLEMSDNTGVDLYQGGRVSYFRSLNDFRNLSDNVKRLQGKENGGRLLIIGSGLLGTELTSSIGRLAKDRGKLEVIEVFKEKSHLYHLLPEDLSLYIQRNIASNHTKLIAQSEVVSIGEITEGPESGRLKININSLTGTNKTTHENVDHVVIAAGVKPDTSLSITADLETDQMLGGFLVNAELQAREGIFVAGDACSFYDPLLGRRRVEHWNHSEESGEVAGHNMAAYVLRTDKTGVLDRIDRSKLSTDILRPRIYDFQSSFSFKLSMFKTIDAVGVIDSGLETRTFVTKDFNEDPSPGDGGEEGEGGEGDPLDMPGVVLYLRAGRVVGVLLWNCDDDLVVDSDLPSPLRTNVARKLLADRARVATDHDLVALAKHFDLSFFINRQVKMARTEEDDVGGIRESEAQS